MNFLKDDFLNQLRAEVDGKTGNVFIEAIEFTPQQILQEVNPSLFETAFTEWCENKKQERLEKAVEILKLHDNASRFNVLKESYKRGAVIPFVGAGMSVPCGYPGWTNYLRKIRSESKVPSNELEDLLKAFKYEEAAQLLYNSMESDEFNEALENEFGFDLPVSGAVRYLPHIFKNSVITTNFDNVLKRCYEEADLSFSETLLGSDALEFPRLLGQEKNVLVKLHGKATSGRNRVLTLNEYENHYAKHGSLQNCIRAISTKTLLFMGCSLGTDRTIRSLKEIVSTQAKGTTPRHYAFLKIGSEEERLERKRELVTANIYPIWYADDHDRCIEALLEKLVE